MCIRDRLWFAARTLGTARRILACQQFGSACFHAAGLWQGAQSVSYTHLDVYKRQLGSEPLEEGIGVPAAAHAVDHLGTVQILFNHLVHGVDVVLTITVEDVYKRQPST